MKRHVAVLTSLAAVLVLAIAVPRPQPARASGDHWIEAYAEAPNTGHVLALPRGDFYNGLAEMAGQTRAESWRVNGRPSGTVLNPELDEEGDPAENTLLHDVADLREALRKAGTADAKATLVLEAYRGVREPLHGPVVASRLVQAGFVHKNGHWVRATEALVPPELPGDESQLAALPREFALYLAGDGVPGE